MSASHENKRPLSHKRLKFELNSERRPLTIRKIRIMKKTFLFLASFIGFSFSLMAQYPDNEDGVLQDLLTPEYYNTPLGGQFRVEINKFVYYARLESFRHPLKDSLGNIPAYTIPTNGTFEAGKGPGDTGEHHKANDMHVGSGDTSVTMYAAYDGYVATYYNALKYRDYLTITKDIRDSNNVLLGKMVTIYGHLDLSLDTLDGLYMNGQYVHQGDIVSKHLWSGTVGGPHLHFEIRYYRASDLGTEDYYGFFGAGLTDSSAGIWTYGIWNPNVGYGFAQLDNHLNGGPTGVEESNELNIVKIYPNPSTDIFTIQAENAFGDFNLSIYNALGQKVFSNKYNSSNIIELDLSFLEQGLYYLDMQGIDNRKYATTLIRL